LKVLFIELLLQKVGIALAGFGTIASGQAVAKGDDYGTAVIGGLCWCGLGRDRRSIRGEIGCSGWAGLSGTRIAATED
jgi:hypothetical protein